jgi:hypothetical protein
MKATKHDIEEWMRQHGYWYSRCPFNIDTVVKIVGEFIANPKIKESKPENWLR